MKFCDEIKVKVVAGAGGPGVVHWKREKYLPKGGPDGGNGGSGGAVIFQATQNKNTLIDFAHNAYLKAAAGKPGEGNNKSGASGANEIFKVPVGTQVFHEDELVADLSEPGAMWVAAKGGNGGKGNAHFVKSTRQAPDFSQPGQSGQEFNFLLVLKSVADVGLAGLPNTGKSTLVSAVSSAKPKIADYPFTTITPQLGVVQIDEDNNFVIADIPGLIQGAHSGKGLGIEFLKHIERTKSIVIVIDVMQNKGLQEMLTANVELSEDKLKEIAVEQHRTIFSELENYSSLLAEKVSLVVFSKSDIDICDRSYHAAKPWFDDNGLECYQLSSATHSGLDKFKLLCKPDVKEN